MSMTYVLADNAFDVFHFSGTPLSHFSTLDLFSLGKEVSKLKATTSIVDPVPVSLFKSCFTSVGPVVEHCK